MQIILRLLGMGGNMRRLAYAQSLEEQRAAWESAWFIRFLRGAPTLLVRIFIKLLSLIFFNRIVLWCAAPALHWNIWCCCLTTVSQSYEIVLWCAAAACGSTACTLPA